MDRKVSLKLELTAVLHAELAVLERAHRATTEAATHEEAKPENDKDTRALEQSYLARGQAARVEQLRAAIVEVGATPTGASARVVLGALVIVEEGEVLTTYWIASQGGGSRLSKGAVQVVTPRSPLGQALIGRVAGDDVELPIGGRRRALSVRLVE